MEYTLYFNHNAGDSLESYQKLEMVVLVVLGKSPVKAIRVRIKNEAIDDRIGFVLVSSDSLYYTGAGFRGDMRGEGGHYYSKALFLLQDKGIEIEENSIEFPEGEDLSPLFVETLRLELERRGYDIRYTSPF